MRRKPKNLETQLDAYAVAVKPLTAGGGRMGNWPIYAVATGSALAMATAANASIIASTGAPIFASLPHFSALGSNARSTRKNIHISDGGLLGGELDLRFGVRASRFRSSYSGVTYKGGFAAAGLYEGLHSLRVLATGGSRSLKNLASGATITGAGSFVRLKTAGTINVAELRSKGTYGGNSTNVGKWPEGEGFAGFKLQNGDLGWLKLSWTGVAGYPDTITLYGWAVQTDGGSIQAGDTGVGSTAPEPGTFALALLAAGAAGVLAWRRRKQPVAE